MNRHRIAPEPRATITVLERVVLGRLAAVVRSDPTRARGLRAMVERELEAVASGSRRTRSGC